VKSGAGSDWRSSPARRVEVALIAALGYPIALPRLSGSMATARPHIARALVQAGHVGSVQEAFERLIGDNGPAYVAYEKFSAAEGIALLRESGSVSVWAHPVLFGGGSVAEVLPELIALGLMGVEVYHPDHSRAEIAHLEALCQEYGLLVTGGSDFHGPRRGGVPLGAFGLPGSLLAPLQAAADTLKAEQG